MYIYATSAGAAICLKAHGDVWRRRSPITRFTYSSLLRCKSAFMPGQWSDYEPPLNKRTKLHRKLLAMTHLPPSRWCRGAGRRLRKDVSRWRHTYETLPQNPQQIDVIVRWLHSFRLTSTTYKQHTHVSASRLLSIEYIPKTGLSMVD